jgi:hypothetical protein
MTDKAKISSSFSTADSRPYATAGGFFIGDRVETASTPWTADGDLGHVVGSDGPDNELVRVELDNGMKLLLFPRYLTRVEG